MIAGSRNGLCVQAASNGHFELFGVAENSPPCKEGEAATSKKCREASFVERTGWSDRLHDQASSFRGTDYPVCAESGGFATSYLPRIHPSSVRRGMLQFAK